MTVAALGPRTNQDTWKRFEWGEFHIRLRQAIEQYNQNSEFNDRTRHSLEHLHSRLTGIVDIFKMSLTDTEIPSAYGVYSAVSENFGPITMGDYQNIVANCTRVVGRMLKREPIITLSREELSQFETLVDALRKPISRFDYDLRKQKTVF